jgi:hypothetical protein
VSTGIHPCLVAALREQLSRRPPGARRLGWKIGGGIAEIEAVTGGLPAFGHLTLDSVGERPEPGDVVLTGSVTQVPVSAGDHVAAEIDGLGRVALQLRR